MKLNADEIFEMAEQIERDGAKFYRKAAENACCDAARQMMESLAGMEDNHLIRFSRMRSELAGAEVKPTVFDPDGEIGLYLKAFVSGKVFDRTGDPAANLTGSESPEQVIQTAIGLEKDSIVFYLGIKHMVPAELGKDHLDDIIQEEMGHIRLLADALAK